MHCGHHGRGEKTELKGKKNFLSFFSKWKQYWEIRGRNHFVNQSDNSFFGYWEGTSDSSRKAAPYWKGKIKPRIQGHLNMHNSSLVWKVQPQVDWLKGCWNDWVQLRGCLPFWYSHIFIPKRKESNEASCDTQGTEDFHGGQGQLIKMWHHFFISDMTQTHNPMRWLPLAKIGKWWQIACITRIWVLRSSTLVSFKTLAIA